MRIFVITRIDCLDGEESHRVLSMVFTTLASAHAEIRRDHARLANDHADLISDCDADFTLTSFEETCVGANICDEDWFEWKIDEVELMAG